MNEKLTKQSPLFLHVLFIIWQLLIYYSDLFRFDVPDAPTDLQVDFVENDAGLTMLRFKFGSTGSTDKYSFLDMLEIMQEYLTYALLPMQKELRPCKGGASVYDVVESLYIDGLLMFENEMWLDVIYVSDPISFEYVKSGGMKGCVHKWYI